MKFVSDQSYSLTTRNTELVGCKLHKNKATGCTAEWPYCPFDILGYI